MRDGGAPANRDSLALGRLATILAVQIQTVAPEDPGRSSTFDPAHGFRKSDLGQERIANELLLKLEIRISPRTVRKYMPKPGSGRPRGDQRWSTFLRNHAQAIVACDFFVAITASFRLIYVFVVMHHSSRRLLHFNVTKQPTADWTLQQLRRTFGPDEAFRYLLHDRDSMFSKGLDRSVTAFGLRVLKSPPRSPKANALCERLIGTIRRECLDWLIPFSERQGLS